MTSVRVLADDLTGALDTGAAFVGLCGPLAVGWRDDSPPRSQSYVIDSETRSEPDPVAAAARMRRHLRGLAGADCAFKKMDSLLRGHTVTELLACIDDASFASLVVAPAFPHQGRRTKGGQQFADFEGAGNWRTIGPNLLDVFARASGRGKGTVHLVAADADACGCGIFICDAETEEEMRSVPERLADIAPPILWCGAAGLAHALATVTPVTCDVPAGSILTIVGTDHPVSVRQLGVLADLVPAAMCRVKADSDDEATRDVVRDRLVNAGVAILAVDFGPVDAATAHYRLSMMINRIVPTLPAPDLLIVTGGETLLMTFEALGARSAIVEGEFVPGIAMGRIVGGAWDGVRFASKSGAFGSPSVFADLLAARGRGMPL